METLAAKKILFVITKSNWGGAQEYVYTLATRFAGAGGNVLVALGGTGEAGASAGLLSTRLAEAGVRTIFISSFARDISITRDFSVFFELLRIVRSEKPDVLHLNSSKAGGLGSLAGRIAGVRRIVFTSHGLAYDEDRPFFIKIFIWLSTWTTFLLAHRTIVISRDAYARARRFPFCKHTIRLVHNGIAPFHPLERISARKKLIPSMSDRDVWIGTIAELTRNKALSYLIRAAALLKKRGRAFVLCIIGEGENRIVLEKLILHEQLSENVFLLGFVPNARLYLSAFDIFTLLSVKEGLPYVLLEAAQAHCAVVGSRISGTTDIVDEQTGILVEAKNVESAERALEMLIDNPQKRLTLGEALRRKVLVEFSIEQMLEKTAAVYR